MTGLSIKQKFNAYKGMSIRNIKMGTTIPTAARPDATHLSSSPHATI